MLQEQALQAGINWPRQKQKQEMARQREKEIALARGSFSRIKAGEQ